MGNQYNTFTTVICRNCNNPFECTIRQARKRKTCSRECQNAWVGKQNSGEHVAIICERCNQSFETTPYRVSQGKRFCSAVCKNPPVYEICLNCGTEFRHSPSHPAKFCSKLCAETSEHLRTVRAENTKRAWQNDQMRHRFMLGMNARSEMPEWKNAPHFQKGEKNPRYKGNRKARTQNYEYSRWVKAVLRRDNFKCQQCDSRKFLQVHHIKAWADYPDLRFEISNGTTLCEECHLKIHGKKRKPRSRVCAHCGNRFRPAKRLQKYCDRKCWKLSH